MANLDEDLKTIIDQETAPSPLQQVVRVAQHLPQEDATKILRYSTATGDAPDVVAANLRNYSTDELGRVDWDAALKDAPQTMRFLSNPLPMAIARSEQNIRAMAALESENKVYTTIANQIKTGFRTPLRSLQGALEGLLSAAPTPEPTEPVTPGEDYLGTRLPEGFNDWAKQTQGKPFLRSVADAAKTLADADMLKEKPVQANTWYGQYGLDLTQGLVQLAQQMAVGAVAGPAAALSYMGAQIAGSDYEQFTKDGVDPGRAATAALGDAALQAPLEAVGLGKIMKKIPAGTAARDRMKRHLEAGLTEGLTEFVQQYPQAGAEIYAKGEGQTPEQMGQQFLDDFWKNTKEGAYQGAIAFPLGVFGGAVHHAMQRQASKAYEEHIENLQQQVAASGLVGVSPELAEQHLEAVTEGEKTYIDPDALVLYQQENPDALKELGLTEQDLNAALQTGEMVEVTKAKYVVATDQDPDMGKALNKHITSATDGLTPYRAGVEAKNAKDVQRATDKNLVERTELQEWSKEYQQQLKEAGLDDDMARQVLVGLQAHARTMSDNPVAWLRENAPEFRTGEAEQAGAMQQEQAKNLVALHNLSPENFLHAARMGGLPVPSLAISRAEYPLEKFGDITLIGNSDLIDPAQKKNKVFNADVYSPRYPTTEHDIDRKAAKSYDKELEGLKEYSQAMPGHINPNVDYLAEQAKQGKKELQYNKVVQLLFASRNGFRKDGDGKALREFIDQHKDQYSDFLDGLLKDISKGERIFKGYTNSGNRRYVPHTLENVVKELTASLRDGEGFNYGVGSLRSNVAKRYTKLAQIQKDRGKIISEEDFAKEKEIVEKEFAEILAEAHEKYTGAASKYQVTDIFTDVLKDGIKRNNIAAELKQYGFEGVDVARVHAFLNGIKNMPTEYFEAKLQRAVGLDEFKGAILPAGTSDKVKQRLDEIGVPYREYEEGKRQEALEAFTKELDAQQGDILFQGTPVMANGSIHWENGKAIITMMQTGNPSTVIHEMVGHFFFQNLIERAAQDDAPEQVKKDVKTLFEWGGHGGKTYDQLTREERTDLHEKVARAAEVYVMEGKAPSIATQSLFRRFAEWMKEVYRSVRELGVQVTPEVAQVFDRMLATDAEIAEMEALERYHEALPETFLSTLNDRQRAHLDKELLKVRAEAEEQLRGRLMPLISEDERQRMAEERTAATERITEQVNGEPICRLERAITDSFKKPARDLARKYKEGKLAQDQEAEFDFLAETQGYTSGDELATHLLESNTAEKEIAARVDKYMKETFPDPMANKPALQEEAREAMYSDGGAALLATELQLIQEKMGKMLQAEEARQAAATAREAAKRTAQTMLAKREINDATRLQSYIAAERRAAVDTAKYLRAKDYENAAAAKERQLMNHALIMESLRIKREVERVKKYLNRQRKSKNWLSDTTDANGLRMKTNEYKEQAISILSRFGFYRKDAVAPEETLAEWVKRQEADEVNGEIINIAPWLAYDNRRSTIGKLTLEELQDVENAIRNIKKMATIGVNSDGFAFINGDGLEETVQGLLDSSARLTDKQVDRIEKEKASAVKDFFAGMRQGHRMLEMLDAFKSFGAWYQTFYDSLKRASDQRSQLLQRITDRMEQAFTSEGITKAERYRMAHKQIYVAEWGQSVTKNTLLAIALNMGNQGNLDRLTATRLIGVSMATPWDVTSIKTVLEKHLTAADFRLIGKLWKAIDVYAEYNDTVQRMTGNSLPKVEPLPITFRVNGEDIHLDGGYYPLSQDTRGSKQAELNAEKKLGDTPGLMPYPSTGRSKARTKGAKYAVDTDLANLYGNMTDIVQDIAFRPVAHDLNKLMRDERVVSTFRSKLGDPAYQAFLAWQKRITSGKAENVKHPMDRFFTWARSATVISSLLLRPGIAVQNLSNVLLYGNSVEGWSNRDAANAYLRHGWGDYIPNALSNSARAKALREYVYSKSVQMRDKMNAPDFSFREINDAGQQENLLMRSGNGTVQEAGYKVAQAQENLNKFASDVFAWTDQLTDIPIWLGAYEKAKAGGKTETQAVNFADAIVRNSTGTGRNLDTSNTQAAGSPAMRLFTMFQTFMNTAYNRWATEAGIFLQEKDAWRLTKFVASQYLAFGILSAFLSFHVPDEDEEWDEWFRKEVLEWPLGMIPLFGGLSKILLDKAQGFKTYSYRMTPLAGKAEDVLKLASTAEKVWQGQKEGGELVEPTAALASFFFRYPDQLNDWFFNAYDALSGNMQPELRDLVKRRPKKERM